MNRDEIATQILCSIVSADWKLDLSAGTWDEAAVKRAYELTDTLIQESKTVRAEAHND
jgi:hypothetical protein